MGGRFLLRGRPSISARAASAEGRAEPPVQSLLRPCWRPVPEHLGQPQPLRLPPVTDRLDDVRRKAGEWQEPTDTRIRHALPLRKVGSWPSLCRSRSTAASGAHGLAPVGVALRCGFHAGRRAFRRHDQLPAAAALQAQRDADVTRFASQAFCPPTAETAAICRDGLHSRLRAPSWRIRVRHAPFLPTDP